MNEQLLKDLRNLQTGYRVRISQLERELRSDPFENIVNLHTQFTNLTRGILGTPDTHPNQRISDINKHLAEEKERSKTWNRTKLYDEKTQYGTALVALNELLFFNHDIKQQVRG